MRDDPILFALPDSGHQQNPCPNAGAAQRAPFGGIGYAEPGRAFGFKRERAFGCAVAVTVGFYNRADRDVRADMLLHGAEVVAQSKERYFGPSAAVERKRAAIGQDQAFKARSIHYRDYSDGRSNEC